MIDDRFEDELVGVAELEAAVRALRELVMQLSGQDVQPRREPAL